MVLNVDGSSCPTINSENWTDVGRVSFSVIDKTQHPDISFNFDHTHFNGGELNNGTAGFELQQADYPEIAEWECGVDIGQYVSEFQVRQEALNALLEWRFSKKLHAGSRFDIERSFDSQLFKSLGTMSAMDSPDQSAFNYMDEEVNNYAGQQLHYRIKMVNPEGDFSYSSIQSLNIERLDEFPLSLSPNPTSSSVDISMKLPQEGMYQMKVLNALGQVVHTKSINGRATFTQVRLDVSELAPGIYVVNLLGNSHVGAAKLTIQ